MRLHAVFAAAMSVRSGQGKRNRPRNGKLLRVPGYDDVPVA
jgi:hypothetical protein